VTVGCKCQEVDEIDCTGGGSNSRGTRGKLGVESSTFHKISKRGNII
jgi:hypothetical protein